MTSLPETLRSQTVVLDGGLATLLEAHGHDLSSKLWSARLLVDDPQAIVAAHRTFFEAGARVAISASYQASVDGFASLGVGTPDGLRLIQRSVELARQASEHVADGGRRWVAGSVGPYGAALADGSEYRGDYGLTVAELRAWHRPRLSALAEAQPDVLALETVPCLAEAEALLAEVADTDVACWLSLTCAGGRTRAGERVDEAFTMARDVPNVFAVGVNCTSPAEVPGLVATAAEASGKPVVVYPNSGEGWDARTHSWTGSRAFPSDQVCTWRSLGANLIGGCCRVGPEEIREVAAAVQADDDAADQER